MPDDEAVPQRHAQVDRAMLAAAELMGYGWPRDAVEPLSGALALHGDDAGVLCLLAIAYSAAGDADAARIAVRRAIATDPEDVDAYELAAALAEADGDVAEARAARAAAVELRPTEPDVAAEQLLLDLRAGTIDAATYAAAVRAASTHPHHSAVNTALAWLAEREGYDGTAERALAAAVAASPADPWSRWLLVRAQERRGGTIGVIAHASLVLAEHPAAVGPLGAFRRGTVRLASFGNGFLALGVVVALLGSALDAATFDVEPVALGWCGVVLLGVVAAQFAVARRLARTMHTGWSHFVRLVRVHARAAMVLPVVQAVAVVAAGCLLVLLAVGAPSPALLAVGITAAAGFLAALAVAAFLDRWYWS
ncbi:hypothetical protein [Curtobacterium sp. ISL-83]|uniref:hypothetical protein n=1 Tax=Curtobacterium sp. ISL-83 TaxID=2819145 RepID=UPI001BED0CE0|nr:hypothetical protein [Curtobacterium sp. ISL-83]MBT2503027.1 hypothetical protein [Curtobacterium sp. ISL-83]